MGSYRIWVRRVEEREEYSVVVHDETSRSLAELGAFSSLHAKKVARDLISLVRREDPEGVFRVKKQDKLPIV